MVSWYYKTDDVEHGPLSQDELVQMAADGRLSPEHLVRNDRKKKWYKAGDVKGLKFPVAAGTLQAASTAAEPAPPELHTSTEALRLLKNLHKKGSDRDDGADERREPPPERRPTRQAALAQAAPRKPLDPKLKLVLWITAGVALVPVLFPPHRVPAEFNLPAGRHTTPLFMPPTVKLKPTQGLGNIDVSTMEKTVEQVKGSDGMVTQKEVYYIRAPLPINWTRLSIECMAVLIVGAAVIGFLAARSVAAQIPDPQPTHPPRRRQV